MELRRWTPLTFLLPARYIENGSFWAEFDLGEWASTEYEWTQDPWNGFVDFAKRPSETVAQCRGDCEDFALVAVTWAIANDKTGVGLGICWQPNRPWPTHVIAFDADHVYSSGDITSTTPDEWVADSKYAFALYRHVN